MSSPWGNFSGNQNSNSQLNQPINPWSFAVEKQQQQTMKPPIVNVWEQIVAPAMQTPSLANI